MLSEIRPELSGRRLSRAARVCASRCAWPRRRRAPAAARRGYVCAPNDISHLRILDGHVIGVDLSAQSVGVGRRQRCRQPLDANKHVTVPIRWCRRADAIATAMPTKNRLSASEPSSSQREEPRCIAGAAWATLMAALPSTRSGSNTIEPMHRDRRHRKAATLGPSKRRSSAGDADDEAERGAAGERRHARPGRRELPVEQHGRQAPQAAAFCRRQRSAQPLEHALDRGVVRGRRPVLRLSAVSRKFSNCSLFISLILVSQFRQERDAGSACHAPAASRLPTPTCREYRRLAHCSCLHRK